MSRRPGSVLTWLATGLAVTFVLVPLLPALLGIGTLIDVGALTAYLPFRAEAGNTSASAVVCRGDTFDFYLPGVAEIRRSVFAGDFPTWAPYEVGGSPLASLPNHGVLSPMSLPYWVLPLWLAPAYVKLLEFAVAIVGMVLFLRRLGVSTAAGLLAGIVYAGSGFMIMWTNWPHTRVAALIPLLFWAIERLLQEVRARDVVVLGAVVASMLLGGFPAIVLFSHTAAAVYVVVRVLTLYGWRRGALPPMIAAAGGVLLGVGLSAVQIIPFVTNLTAFDFASRSEVGHHLPRYAAFTLLDPYAIGTCVGREVYGPANPIEAIGFLGGAALLLAAAGVVLRRRAAAETVPTRFFSISTLLLGTAIWVGGPALTLLQLLPLWSTNFVGRAQSVFGFFVAVLAGAGFDRLSRGSSVATAAPARRLSFGSRRWLWVAILGAALMIASLSVTLAMISAARRYGFSSHVAATVPIPLMITIAAGAALVLAARASQPDKLGALAALAVLAVLPSAVFANALLPVSRVQDFYPDTSTHEYLRDHLGMDRYAAQGTVMLAPTSDFYQLRTPVGHEFTAERWKDLLAAADPSVQRSITYSMFAEGLPVEDMATSPALDQLAVRYWVMSPRKLVGDREPMPDGSDDTVAISEGSAASCTVPGGPMRGIRVQLEEAVPKTESGGRPLLHVAVTSGGVEREGSILIDSELDPGRLFVTVAGEDLPSSSTAQVRVWLTGTEGGERVFRGERDQLDCAAVRPADDGLRLVQSDAGGAIYQRLDALPRIRWAARSRVVVDPAERVRELKAGVPEDTVLLEDARLEPAQGASADIEVLADERERVSTRVDAKGDGYLVLSDSIVRPGWRASVDGSPVALEHGNHAFAAIPVPAGEHIVTLEYVAPGLKLGTLVTFGSLLLAAVPVAGPTLVRRLSRRRRHRWQAG